MNPTVGPLTEVTCVRRDSFVVSGPDGQILPGGDLGVYVRDARFLDQFELRVDGIEPRPLAGGLVDADRAVFHGYLPPSRDHDIDPAVLITRRRLVDGGVHEEVVFANNGEVAVELSVEVLVGTDFAYIFDVRHGRRLRRIPPVNTAGALVFARPDGDERLQVDVTVDGSEHPVVGASGLIHIPIEVASGQSRTICFDLTATDVYGTSPPQRRCNGFHTAISVTAGPSLPVVRCSESAFARLVSRSLDDLEGLAVDDPDAPGDRFAAAGSPWFLTLFGRDSIWAALMALPFDPGLAIGTLRALARRQGTRDDPDTEEAPGKILHEVRRGALTDRGDLPPNYYGSVDATPLFVVLAHEAWRWGVPPAQIEPLIPHVEAALGWMTSDGDPDGDGFLEYARQGGRGLANQGWKDSGDGIRFADGRHATAPIALAEVQGYAYAAARGGADLLAAFDRPGAEHWRDWAAAMAVRFREHFWVHDDRGPYPAVALDADNRPVDSVASNMGHLLFTGILDREEATAVGNRLRGRDMDSGWGLRTLSTDNGGYNPLSYHCGSVWPHDTAIGAWGAARAGQDKAALALLEGLVRAAPSFQYRLPELFAGVPSGTSPDPVPYPTACRPQAWAAAGALLLVRSALGLDVDVPAGRITLRPMHPAPFEWLEIRGMPVGEGTVDIRWDGRISVAQHGTDLVVDVVHR